MSVCVFFSCSSETLCSTYWDMCCLFFSFVSIIWNTFSLCHCFFVLVSWNTSSLCHCFYSSDFETLCPYVIVFCFFLFPVFGTLCLLYHCYLFQISGTFFFSPRDYARPVERLHCITLPVLIAKFAKCFFRHIKNY